MNQKPIKDLRHATSSEVEQYIKERKEKIVKVSETIRDFMAVWSRLQMSDDLRDALATRITDDWNEEYEE